MTKTEKTLKLIDDTLYRLECALEDIAEESEYLEGFCTGLTIARQQMQLILALAEREEDA